MKKLFDTPMKAVLSVLCIVAGVAVLGTGAAFAVNAIAKKDSDENNMEKKVTSTEIVNPPQQSENQLRQNDEQSSGQTQINASQTPKSAEQNANQTQNQSGQISVDAAKETALADAGADASTVTFTKTKQEYDDGALIYEIEFFTAKTEYEYEIDAVTGAIRSKDAEMRNMHSGQDGNHSNAQQSAASISEEQAKSIAASHAGFSVDEVIFKEVKLDYDDGLMEYEIEFVKDNREYEYKLNAANGEIVEYDLD